MSAPVDVLAVKSFAGRGHARYLVVAGANPREKGIHDAAFGHYGITVAKVSFEHEYSHAPEVGADFAADYANRLVACADAMKGIEDPRAFVAAIAGLIKALDDDLNGDDPAEWCDDHASAKAERERVTKARRERLIAAIARVGSAGGAQ